MTFKAENEDTIRYSYDLLGNLINVLLPEGILIEYFIDGQNRRVGKLVNGEFKKGWLYQDQINPVAEIDSLGNISSRFVYATKGHVPDYMVKGDSTYRFITDHLGSVRLVVNVERGDVAQRIDYDEFGNVLVDTNPGFQPFGFAGGLTDNHTGFVRFGARDYDAEVGRWTAKDPMGFGGNDTNFYGYSLIDPVNSTDIYGLFGAYIGIGASCGFGYRPSGDEPNLATLSYVGYLGTIEDAKGGMVDIATLGGGRMVGGTLGFGFLAGLFFGNYGELSCETNSIGINIFGFSVEIVLNQNTNKFLGLQCGFGGRGWGLGAYAVQNFSKVIKLR